MNKLKQLTLLVLCFFATTGVDAQITERNILAKNIPLTSVEKHLIQKKSWKPYPKTSDEWKALLPQKLIDIHIQEAEALQGYDFSPVPATVMLDFVRSGDRTRHSKIHFDKRRALMSLTLAESMEGKGRFVEQIMNGIWAICEESYWGVPAHIRETGLPDVENPYVDLFAAETAATLSMADYFIGDELDKINPYIRKRIFFETNERVFVPMLNDSKNYRYMNRKGSVNNWNPWIMSNYMTAALFIEKDEKRRAKMAYEALYGMDAYLNGLGEDGGCDEGPSYWFAAGACVFDCLDLFYSAAPKAQHVYQVPLIQKMASYVYKTHIAGNYFTNFADADPKVSADGVVLYRFGKAIDDPTLKNFGTYVFHELYEDDYDNPTVGVSTHHQMRKVQNLLAFKEISEQEVTYQPVSDAWISDIQLMLSRSNDRSIVLAAHGGHNSESHNHNDVGDFIIYKNGKPLLIDAGRGNYTARTFSPERYGLWFTQSEYHNLPVINGVGQKNGREYEATNVSYEKIKDKVRLALDIANSYPEEAGAISWIRKLNFDKSKNIINISESYELNEANSIEQVFMSVAKVDTSQKGKITMTDGDAQLTISYDPKLWSVRTDLPSTEGMEYESFKTKWDSKPVQRIIMTHLSPESKGNHSFNITF